MSNLKRSFINMVTGGLGYVVPMLLNLIFTPLLLSKLGEAAYGLQSLVNVIIGYLMVADMGLDIPIIKYVSEYNAKKDWQSLNKILNNTFKIYLIIGIAGALTIVLLSDIFISKLFNIPVAMHAEAKNVFLLAGLGFLGSVLSMWGRAVCNGLQRYDIANGVSITNNFFSTALGILLVVFGAGVVGYILVRVVFSFLAGLAYIYFGKRLVPVFNLNRGFNITVWNLLKSQIGYGVTLRISGILGSGLDRTLIGAWLGVAAVGIYSIPFLIASSVCLLMSSVTHFVFPMASALHSTNKTQELISLFLKGTKFVVILSTIIFGPLLLFGDKFLSLWIGPDLAEKASTSLLLLCVSFYINSILYLIGSVFMVGIGKLNVFTRFAISRSIVMAIGFIFLIKPYGINGAALAMVLSCIVDILFFIVTIKWHLGISISRIIFTSYLKPILLALIVSIPAYFIRPIADNWIGLVTTCSVFITAYIVAGYFSNIFEDEKIIILKLLEKISKNKTIEK